MAERKKSVVKLSQEYLDKDVPELNEHSDTDEAKLRQEIAATIVGSLSGLPLLKGVKPVVKFLGVGAGISGLMEAPEVASKLADKYDDVMDKKWGRGEDRPPDTHMRTSTINANLPLPEQYAATKKAGGKVGKKSKPIGIGQALRGYGAVRKK